MKKVFPRTRKDFYFFNYGMGTQSVQFSSSLGSITELELEELDELELEEELDELEYSGGTQ